MCIHFVYLTVYELRLNKVSRGTVSIRHFDIWGYICADDFDDAEATVICREKKFQAGFAYFQNRYSRNNKNLGKSLFYLDIII